MKNWITNKSLKLELEAFKRNHPDSKILMTGPTKVIRLPAGAAIVLERGENWAKSVRGILIMTPDELVCQTIARFADSHSAASGMDFADFNIPIHTIHDAKLLSLTQGGVRGFVLTVPTIDGPTYQFGLNQDEGWSTRLPFPAEFIQTTIGWSQYSIKARIKLAVYVLIFIAVLILLIVVR
ncbi:MAG: hypothetical protein H0T53_05870 [Herpetosiphonaceae bacterium]|nr:hypothetical protein [Herpetosiphonaceae bacterium]